MNISNRGTREIISHEGIRLKAYRCPAGVITIGAGFTWASSSFRNWWKQNRGDKPFNLKSRMKREEVEQCLSVLIRNEYGKEVNDFLWKTKHPQHVYDAAVSMVFNCGPRALKWKWAKEAKLGNYKASAGHLRKTAITADGIKLEGLVRRRKQEAALMEHGIYSYGSKGVVTVAGNETGVLRRGNRGLVVAKLIRDLTALGYYDGVQDDRFGYGTEAAVLAFQTAKGLNADGAAGPVTLKAVETALQDRKRNQKAAMGAAVVAAAGAGASLWDKISAFFTGLF